MVGAETVVLIADDSNAVRTILKGHLAVLGARVVEAATGEEALFVAQAQPIDIALLDVDMPGLSGFDVLAVMRSDPALAQIPVIFLTARGHVNDLVEGLSLGANDYVRKPWDAEELRARIQVALRLKTERDELRALNAELDRMGSTDPLTGLRNRRGLEQDIARLARLLRSETCGVLVVDIDRFKSVNDTHGHTAGDAVLRTVAERIQACATPRQLVARWGGEEFVVLAPGANGVQAERLAERIRTVVAFTPVPLPTGGEVPVTISVGVTAGSLGEPTLITSADAALYEAKRAGRNRTVVHAS